MLHTREHAAMQCCTLENMRSCDGADSQEYAVMQCCTLENMRSCDAGISTLECTAPPVYRSSSILHLKCIDPRVYRPARISTLECTAPPVYRSSSIQVYRPSSV